jgi:hypothetical protein
MSKRSREEVSSSDESRGKCKARASDSDSDSEDSSSGSDECSGSESNRVKRANKSSKKAKKKEKKSTKKKKKRGKKDKHKKDKKKSKHKKGKQRCSEAEVRNQAAIDALDQEAKDFAASIGGPVKLSEKEQASLLHSDFESRAASLGLPKGLIRTTGMGGGSGLFSAAGRFGDKATHQQLAGGFGGDDNPATAARRKREYQAQQAEARAREILLERAATAAAAGGGDAAVGSGFASLASRFGTANVEKRFM